MDQNQSIKRYAFMVQFTTYTGEGAYIVVSIIDAEGPIFKHPSGVRK